MIKKLLVLIPAAMLACSFAIIPVRAETVIIKKDHHHHYHPIMHRDHHDERRVIDRH